MSSALYIGDALEWLRKAEGRSVQCCVTSPPYFRLRDYGHDKQLGMESTINEYIANMVNIFSEVKRVLSDTGTLWLNIGDTYYGSGRGGNTGIKTGQSKDKSSHVKSLKGNGLMGIPWRLALALQADGWILRQDIIWHKPNPMPESVTNRCTKAHEYIFLFSKQPNYYFNKINEPVAKSTKGRMSQDIVRQKGSYRVPGKTNGAMKAVGNGITRNARSVWTIPVNKAKHAHFATFPEKLVEKCLMASLPKHGTVLDPFCGSGTVGVVAERMGNDSVLIDINPEYIEIAKERVGNITASQL